MPRRIIPVTCPWHIRSQLYKIGLVLVMVGLPANLIAIVIPFWLEDRNAIVSRSGDTGVLEQNGQPRKVYMSYGLWQLCAEPFGCFFVHEAEGNVGVGGWMYAVEVLMIISIILHVISSVCGFLQNFVPRPVVRRWSRPFWKKVAHMDSTFLEDIGFLAGFFGQVSTIVFLLCTKEQVSEGAHYSYCFAISFLATIFTVIATLTVTKVHHITPPRIPRAAPPRIGGASGGGGGDQGAAAGAQSSNPSDPGRQQPPTSIQSSHSTSSRRSGGSSGSEMRRRDASRTDQGDAAGVLAQSQPGVGAAVSDVRVSGREGVRSSKNTSSSPTRRRSSKSRSREGNSGDGSGGSVRRREGNLHRTEDLENIPAAVCSPPGLDPIWHCQDSSKESVSELNNAPKESASLPAAVARSAGDRPRTTELQAQASFPEKRRNDSVNVVNETHPHNKPSGETMNTPTRIPVGITSPLRRKQVSSTPAQTQPTDRRTVHRSVVDVKGSNRNHPSQSRDTKIGRTSQPTHANTRV